MEEEEEEEEGLQLQETRVGDLPEACLAHAIALTSPRDACRCAAVSPAFRAAADSDLVWARFIPEDHHRRAVALHLRAAGRDSGSRKDAYLALCDGGGVPVDVDGDGDGDGDGGCSLWLDKASGAKCYALSARRLSLPWEDGDFSWRWTPHAQSSNLYSDLRGQPCGVQHPAISTMAGPSQLSSDLRGQP